MKRKARKGRNGSLCWRDEMGHARGGKGGKERNGCLCCGETKEGMKRNPGKRRKWVSRFMAGDSGNGNKGREGEEWVSCVAER